jgi:hypothetical protein
MPGSWYTPIDPECPAVKEYMDTLFDDPMTAYSGCGDEIAEGWESRHKIECERCQEYGAANIEVNY